MRKYVRDLSAVLRKHDHQDIHGRAAPVGADQRIYVDGSQPRSGQRQLGESRDGGRHFLAVPTSWCAAASGGQTPVELVEHGVDVSPGDRQQPAGHLSAGFHQCAAKPGYDDRPQVGMVPDADEGLAVTGHQGLDRQRGRQTTLSSDLGQFLRCGEELTGRHLHPDRAEFGTVRDVRELDHELRT